ncbi:MAG TPA: hypothetical protein VFZ59_19320 [Verrucomicrobiae bacterium]|nr:hypothetical protein [Verrucomicrobiae bacterium]
MRRPERERSQDWRQLSSLREALFALHKTLIDSERVSYEQTMGTIGSPNHFLQLLTSDPWFAWLQPLSHLVVAVDVALDEKEPLTAEAVAALRKQTSQLLVATEVGDGFPKHYFDALQRDPDVVLAHARVMKSLNGHT